MKSVFVIHSPIALLITKQIVKDYKLRNEDIYILTLRKFIVSEFDNVFSLPELIPSLCIFKSWIKVYNLRNRILTFLSSKQFDLYIPSSGFPIFQLLTRMESCHSYSYMEEGMVSYHSVERKNSLHISFFSRKIYLLGWLRNIFYMINFPMLGSKIYDFYECRNNKFKDFYAISELAFPDIANKKILTLPFEKCTNYKDKSRLSVIVLEAFAQANLLKLDDYLYALQKLLKYLVSKNETIVYIKFHPVHYQFEGSQNAFTELLETFSNEITVIYLKRDQTLENMAYTFKKNVCFYHIASSIGIYANICGSKSATFKKFLPVENTAFNEYLESLPRVFFEVVCEI
ncbi:hypothetical protein SAMN06265379_111114 [Saccharicrinis carchari]|uniref:Glycosyltransferase family 52 n=1 Tax=Saccharicrinis carchari TaxID=1168039 RepID=A0A521EXP6_SACCC|nr:polysialyltransferase family glycosyltransferase [Saccharicrinis carchari]SMO87910.1 hypothetical protein SAMN06265379_111114 [Saccharicrinis carchari]